MKPSFETLCAKDIPGRPGNRPHVLPLVQSASFEFDNIEQGIRIFKDQSERQGYVYSRYDNPTVRAVADKIAGLEAYDQNIEAHALMCSSGMSAITIVCQMLAQNKKSLLASDRLYGGTTEMFNKVLRPNGVSVVYADFTDKAAVESALVENPETGMLFYESPANPGLECMDMSAIGQLAMDFNCLHVVDNTVCTPYLQRPFNFGADLVVHSTTKYLNGHGTATGGIIISKDRELVNNNLWPLLKLMGVNPSPFDCWMLHHGLKTLPIRMCKQSSNAMKLAEYLNAHPKIEKVNYPGLKQHPQHQLAREQMAGFGGLLSFYLKADLQRTISFINKLEYCSLAPTLGDLDTLLLHPATSSHLNISREDRIKQGVKDNLVRISVGIENGEDLLSDFENALKSIP